ncbi:MAG: hypothetical protein WC985_06155 [Thermoplasmata archaeon]
MKISRHNLGHPHAEVEIGNGRTDIRCPSQEGKTSAYSAYFLLLLGVDGSGKPMAKGWPLKADWSIEVAFPKPYRLDAKGIRVGDTLLKTRQEFRDYHQGDPRRFDPARVLAIGSPEYWRGLKTDDLRDLLVAGPTDAPLLESKAATQRVCGRLCEDIVRGSEHWQAGDPVLFSKIDEARLDADKGATLAAGRLQEATAALDALLSSPDMEPEDAAAILARNDRWDTYARERKAWDGIAGLGECPGLVKGLADLRTRAAELRKVAEDRAAEERAGGELLRQARCEAEVPWSLAKGPDGARLAFDLSDVRREVERQQEADTAAHEAFEAVKAGKCPTCIQAWPAGQFNAGEALKAAEKRLKSAKFDLSDAVDKDAAAEAAYRAEWEERVKGAEAALATAHARTMAADDEAEKAGDAAIDVEAAIHFREVYIARRATILAECYLTAAPASKPTRPDCEPVSDDEAKRARGAIARTEGEDRIGPARKRVAELKATHAEKVARAERLASLARVAREAPALLLPGALADLRKHLPDWITVSDDLEILCDGREPRQPYVSRGRLLFFDLTFRAALRAAWDMPGTFLWVDQAQDWQPRPGTADQPWPDLERVCYLWTVAP